jgi:hypothetical protein
LRGPISKNSESKFDWRCGSSGTKCEGLSLLSSNPKLRKKKKKRTVGDEVCPTCSAQGLDWLQSTKKKKKSTKVSLWHVRINPLLLVAYRGQKGHREEGLSAAHQSVFLRPCLVPYDLKRAGV